MGEGSELTCDSPGKYLMNWLSVCVSVRGRWNGTGWFLRGCVAERLWPAGCFAVHSSFAAAAATHCSL